MKIKNAIKKFFSKHILKIIIVVLVGLTVLWAMHVRNSNSKQLDVTQVPPSDTGQFGDVEVHDSSKGTIIIGMSGNETYEESMTLTSDPETIWDNNQYMGNFTPLSSVKKENRSIGILTINSIRLSANVFESPDTMEAMDKGIAHFPHSSAWDGNVSLSAHNVNFNGSAGYFYNLHSVKVGDTIQYQTELGTRTYQVTELKTIQQSDWSDTGHSDTNTLTLITCITGQPANRLCVIAKEVAV